jgi:prolyl-tRNA synthetase
LRNAFGGANKANADLLNINVERDWQADIWGDIGLAAAGMVSREGGKLVEKRGIEVGNIFQLGYHYSNLMDGAEYTDAEGMRQKLYMGCYGIGIGRTMAAIVEAHHDERGIRWPERVAPFAAALVRLGSDEEVLKAADKLYDKLLSAGVDVLYDDRDESAGVKFADTDLIGVPVRLTVSKKTLEHKAVEVKNREEKDLNLVPLDSVVSSLNRG